MGTWASCLRMTTWPRGTGMCPIFLPYSRVGKLLPPRQLSIPHYRSPWGSFIFNDWDRIEANEFSDLVTRTAAEVFPDDPPQFLARTPHGYHDTGQVRRDLIQAGYSDITITTLQEVSRTATARDAAVAYCMGTPLRNEIEARDGARLDLVTDLAAQAIGKKFGDGSANCPVEGKISGHVITAIR